MQHHKADAGLRSGIEKQRADVDNFPYSATSSAAGLTSVTRFDFRFPVITSAERRRL